MHMDLLVNHYLGHLYKLDNENYLGIDKKRNCKMFLETFISDFFTILTSLGYVTLIDFMRVNIFVLFHTYWI
uniref:Uncharacterized protein n=1 Tax=Heterorhabditis bacteriophora TaxID=37862 RepID=A0A1I7WAL6_HETBA